MADIDFETVDMLLAYDKESGNLTWKKRCRDLFKDNRSFNTWNSRYAGKVAGRIVTSGGKFKKRYIKVGVLGCDYFAHRICWLLITGEWPNDEIDHLNGDGTDNREANLRDVSRSENQRNMRLHRRNKSGVSGVSTHTVTKKWVSHICINGKVKHIGCFDDFFEAVCARKSEENKRNYHKNHGFSRPL